ncbi:hypothetical protein Pelo_6847 [Pelomyxa schiedti]|nr:hypothetical protein Pelo_6847 [Pelomyxa schiedti]
MDVVENKACFGYHGEPSVDPSCFTQFPCSCTGMGLCNVNQGKNEGGCTFSVLHHHSFIGIGPVEEEEAQMFIQSDSTVAVLSNPGNKDLGTSQVTVHPPLAVCHTQ